MPERLRLPSPPPTLRHLSNNQSRLLEQNFISSRTGFCPTCGDEKVITWYARPEERNLEDLTQYDCDCPGQFLLHRRFLWSGILETFQRLDWYDLSPSVEAASEILDYADEADTRVPAGLGITMWGGAGTGKTFLANLLAKDLVLRSNDVFVVTFNDFIAMFSAGWSDTDRRDYFSGRVRSAGVLVLDDIGKENRMSKGEELGVRTLETTLRYRVQRSLPTILTTNIPPEGIDTGYGKYTASLLSEVNRLVEVGGSDYRSTRRATKDAEVRAGIKRPVLM